jgi:hypothetical protein
MVKRLFVLIFLFATSAVWAQRLLTVPDISAFLLRDGRGTPAIGVRALPDGGTLMYGQFEVWYEGNRFRDILRLKPGGDPDTMWRIELEAATGSDSGETGVSRVSVTPYGIFLVGTFSKINGKYVSPWPLLAYDSPTVRNGSAEPVA